MRIQLEKRGVLSTGQVNKGGSLPRHIPIYTEHIYVSTPPGYNNIEHSDQPMAYLSPARDLFPHKKLNQSTLYKNHKTLYSTDISLCYNISTLLYPEHSRHQTAGKSPSNERDILTTPTQPEITGDKLVRRYTCMILQKGGLYSYRMLRAQTNKKR